MIANHPQFIEAIQQCKRVRVRFYSVADSAILDQEYVPLDYGQGASPTNLAKRYWLKAPATSRGPAEILGLSSQQIVDLHVTGETFDPAEQGPAEWTWSVAREWPTPPVTVVSP
jgi:hypothetical protein